MQLRRKGRRSNVAFGGEGRNTGTATTGGADRAVKWVPTLSLPGNAACHGSPEAGSSAMRAGCLNQMYLSRMANVMARCKAPLMEIRGGGQISVGKNVVNLWLTLKTRQGGT